MDTVSSRYKITLKYGGYFRLSKNSSKKRYCFGYQKTIYIESSTYSFEDITEEVNKLYPSNRGLVFSTWFVDKDAMKRTFIKVDCDGIFQSMFSMYYLEKELTIYATTSDTNPIQEMTMLAPNEDEESEYALSDEDYHSHYSTDNDHEFEDDVESVSQFKKTPTMKVHSKFQNVIEFRKAMNHYALINEFEYFIEKSDLQRFTARCTDKECKWRIHASLMEDGVTFEVKSFVEIHSCTQSNKDGNKLATQGWIASVVSDKLKCEWDVSVTDLRSWDIFVNSYFTLEKYKAAYAMEIAPMPTKNQWVDTGEKIYPPTIKRPPGRPRKNRIKAHDEHQQAPKRRHKCPRCGEYGHHERTCKNPAPQN